MSATNAAAKNKNWLAQLQVNRSQNFPFKTKKKDFYKIVQLISLIDRDAVQYWKTFATDWGLSFLNILIKSRFRVLSAVNVVTNFNLKFNHLNM